MGAFIYGLDSDTVDSINRRAQYIAHCGVDVIQTTVLTPLPGTRLFHQYFSENRLIFTDFPSDWDHYDMSEVVYQPAQMSAVELQKAISSANQRINGLGYLGLKFFQTMFGTRKLMTSIWALSSNLNYRKVGVSTRESS